MDIYLSRLPMLFVSLLVALNAVAQIEYDFNSLTMKNSEQVQKILSKKINLAQKYMSKSTETDEGIEAHPEAKAHLKDAARIVFSRMDQDGARTTLIARIRRDLSDIGEFENVLHELALEGLKAIKANKASAVHQATYIVMLQNIMAEVRPEVGDNEEIRKLIEAIRDADIKVSDQVKSKIRIRSMAKVLSPSERAREIVPAPKR